jgi:enterochelin esterase-like enzyme/mannose-6-phosphate isomerase-like protein (cupin superfamily)
MFEKRAGQIAYHPNPPKNGTDDVDRACVYVPAAATSRILYLLHGVGDTEYSWEIQGRLSAIVEDTADNIGAAPPLVVMPFGFVTQENKIGRRFPAATVFADWLRPLMAKVELAYRTKKVLTGEAPQRAIAGLSMGGKQALEFGLSHPDLFSAIGAFSAAVQNRGEGAAVDRVTTLAAAASPRPDLYASCGTQDDVDGLVAANQELIGALAARDIALTFTWMSGRHEWPVWRRSLEGFLRFWFKRPLDTTAAPVRRIQKIEPILAQSAIAVAAALAQGGRHPYIQEHRWPERVAPHYHRTDEELQVTRGSMTFIDIRNGPQEGVELKTGERLLIPEGTVHTVTIGRDGVEYAMGLAHAVPIEQFPVFLPVTSEAPLAGLVDLVEANYQFAEAEEAGAQSTDYFDRHLAPRFLFLGAAATQSTDKENFIKGLDNRKNAGRRSHGLYLRCQGTAIAATITVTTADQTEYLNTRLFEKATGGDRWVCVRWANLEARGVGR